LDLVGDDPDHARGSALDSACPDTSRRCVARRVASDPVIADQAQLLSAGEPLQATHRDQGVVIIDHADAGGLDLVDAGIKLTQEGLSYRPVAAGLLTTQQRELVEDLVRDGRCAGLGALAPSRPSCGIQTTPAITAGAAMASEEREQPLPVTTPIRTRELVEHDERGGGDGQHPGQLVAVVGGTEDRVRRDPGGVVVGESREQPGG
jgi:hypothetical protein